MKKTLIVAALVAASFGAHAQTKKELVQKIITAQQAGIDAVARNIVERPAAQLMQAAGPVLQQQVPADKREAAAKSIEADVKKFVDESVPLLRERANKTAPTVLGPIMEEKFTEDELKQLLAWLESPVNKKYVMVAPEMQNALAQKLIAEAGPLLDPKLQALQQRVRTTLGVPAPSASAPARPASR